MAMISKKNLEALKKITSNVDIETAKAIETAIEEFGLFLEMGLSNIFELIYETRNDKRPYTNDDYTTGNPERCNKFVSKSSSLAGRGRLYAASIAVTRAAHHACEAGFTDTWSEDETQNRAVSFLIWAIEKRISGETQDLF